MVNEELSLSSTSAHSESFLHTLLVFAFSYSFLQVSQHSALVLKVKVAFSIDFLFIFK